MIFYFVLAVFILLIVGHTFYWEARKKTVNLPKYFAHRGVKINFPENTLASYQDAINLGFNGLEIDVCSLKDGTVVCSHNYDLEKETDGTGWLFDLDYSQIKKFQTGIKSHPKSCQKIPRLIDVLEVLPKQTFLNIEIKYKNIFDFSTARVIAELAKKKIIDQPFVVSTFNPLIVAYFKAFHRQVLIGYLVENHKWLWLMNIIHPDFLHPDGLIINQKIINKCKKHNLEINTWTINSIDAVEWCHKNNISSVITDNPQIIKKWKQ